MVAIYIKYWGPKDVDPDLPKVGLDWWRSKYHGRSQLSIIFFNRVIDFTFTKDASRYERDLKGCPIGWRLV